VSDCLHDVIDFVRHAMPHSLAAKERIGTLPSLPQEETMSTPREDRFNDLLLEYSQEPNASDRQEIEQRLWREYGEERAVLVLDMAGFSKLVQKHGVVHYLSMVRRMQLTTLPIVEDFGGNVVKFEADDCFASFPDTLKAIRCCVALNHAFEAANLLTPDELDIKISCGIDYGPILVVDAKKLFGKPVNRASKLGEDIAGPGEILVTEEAMSAVPQQTDINFDPVRFSISGVEIKGFIARIGEG
jgi:adenylate cyclase